MRGKQVGMKSIIQHKLTAHKYSQGKQYSELSEQCKHSIVPAKPSSFPSYERVSWRNCIWFVIQKAFNAILISLFSLNFAQRTANMLCIERGQMRKRHMYAVRVKCRDKQNTQSDSRDDMIFKIMNEFTPKAIDKVKYSHVQHFPVQSLILQYYTRGELHIFNGYIQKLLFLHTTRI